MKVVKIVSFFLLVLSISCNHNPESDNKIIPKTDTIKSYNANGNMSSMEVYIGGVLRSDRHYWPNGKLKEELYKRNNKFDSVVRLFNKDGVKIYESFLKKDDTIPKTHSKL